MIVLDTNVVSELMRRSPESRVLAWIDLYPASEVMITAVTAAELLYGVARLPEGRSKNDLHAAVESLLAEDFRDQILPFDATAAAHYADIVATRERVGRPVSMADAQIAAICRTWRSGLATRNVTDFADTGVETINPWEAPEG